MASRLVILRDAAPSVEVSVGPRVVKIIRTAQTGPPGPQGPAGAPGASAGDLTKIAQVALSGQRAVKLLTDGIQVNYADNTDAGSRQLSVALTKNAALAGDLVTLLTFGDYEEPSWSWTPGGVIYLGTNGLLTQTAPSAPAFLRILGTAVSTTRIWWDPQPPIVQV